jgi:endonuclease/exonuclease/phosphatase family metal-dependent hydrolase
MMFASIAHAESLKILSWNVYLVPWPIHRTLQDERAHAMADQLLVSNYDAIFFQEIFLEKHKDLLWQKLKNKFPNESGLFKGSGLHLVGSGLWAISKYPLKVIDHVYFTDCEGSDCVASKGGVLIELQLPNRKIQVLNTHLQAWAGEENSKIRRSQLAQLKVMLDKNKQENILQVAVGDMNVEAADAFHYRDLLTILGLQDGLLTSLLQFSAGKDNFWRDDGRQGQEKDKLIDYILLASSPPVQIKRSIVKRTSRMGKDTVDLSDHYGVEASLLWP